MVVLLRSRGCLLYHTVALLVGLLALVVFTLTIGHFLSVDDTLSPADAIVVLGGGRAEGRRSGGAEERGRQGDKVRGRDKGTRRRRAGAKGRPRLILGMGRGIIRMVTCAGLQMGGGEHGSTGTRHSA